MIWAFWIDSVTITRGILDGRESLGGSESACLGLMRALAARGHTIHAFTPKLAPEAVGIDSGGVAWHPGEEFQGHPVWLHTDWDVFVSLRMPYAIGQVPISARFRILWNQDLLYPVQADSIMGSLWQTDAIAYVSAFHRAQWEALVPTAAPLGWVTRNGFDPTLLPTDRPKRPQQIIHVSRPERALVRGTLQQKTWRVEPGPLLEMWPAIRQARPDAELHLCRYSSMYDAEGWGQVCRLTDQLVAELHREVGGIVWRGELGKRELYEALAESAVLWYPGLVDFAETSCLAVIEAQACGTPVVASHRGALPETVPSGLLIRGDAMDATYQTASVAAVLDLLASVDSPPYAARVAAGRAHVQPGYTFPALAEAWETFVLDRMTARTTAAPSRVVETLLRWDDHVTARVVAAACGDGATVAWCDHVLAGEDQTADDYAARAIADPLAEMVANGRVKDVLPWYAESRRLLDVACGNGAAALMLATAHPHLTVIGVDYSAANIARATAAAETLGLRDRVQFVTLPVYDYQTHALAPAFTEWLGSVAPFDAVFCGEFLEHCANAVALIDGLERACQPGGVIGYTMPHGPFTALLERHQPVKRGHVHAFELDDLGQLFGAKDDLSIQAQHCGQTRRTERVGHWLVRYRAAADRPTYPRDLEHRARAVRPWPKLSALIIAYNEAPNLGACLESIWGTVDEIVVGDCGSTDETVEVATRYGARIVSLPRIGAVETADHQWQGFDFSDARNAVLAACTGDWVLWIDADETLEGAMDLGKYLWSGPFLGYAIAQVHLSLDAPTHHDLPVRVFRRRPEIRWFGSIHEQPQWEHANGDIWPALELPDVKIAHRGYRTLSIRNQKRKRNLPLLMLDRQRYPDRRLGLVLWIRDLVQEAEEMMGEAGRLTETAAEYLTRAIDCFEAELNVPGDKLYPFARPWYERAVKLTTDPWEFALTVVGQPHGLNGTKPQIQRVWVRSPEQIRPLIEAQLAHLTQRFTPTPILLELPTEEP